MDRIKIKALNKLSDTLGPNSPSKQTQRVLNDFDIKSLNRLKYIQFESHTTSSFRCHVPGNYRHNLFNSVLREYN